MEAPILTMAKKSSFIHQCWKGDAVISFNENGPLLIDWLEPGEIINAPRY
jgi:hypothetical protein